MSTGLATHASLGPLPVHAAAHVPRDVSEEAGMGGGAAVPPDAAASREQSRDGGDDEPAVSPRGSCSARFWSCPGSAGFKVRE